MKNLVFNPSRFGYLLRNDIELNYKRVLLAALAFFAFLAVFMASVAFDSSGNDLDFHSWVYPNTMIFFGCIFTGFAFKEMANVHERHFYLSLPASHLEKFTVRWLLTVLGFPLIFTLSYLLFSWISGIVIKNFGGEELHVYNPFSLGGYVFLRVYISVQSLFLLGAIFFQKYTVIKTGATLFVLTILGALLTMLLFYLMFYPYFDGSIFDGPSMDDAQPSQAFQDFVEFKLISLIEFGFYYILPVFCWIISYLKLTEKEI